MCTPDYIFEMSWEVCQKIGGIYTVLSTRAKTLHEQFGDCLIFIGPDCWKTRLCPFFQEDDNLFAEWVDLAKKQSLPLRVGRWQVPGEPVAILVDFSTFYAEKNQIYAQMWELFQVDSLHAYGDYDEASMFAYAAAKVVESFYRFYLNEGHRVVCHGNEWMTGMGLLYLRHHLPQVATLFTTHATTIGRSIAGNGKPLYDYFQAYDGNQMARELNVQSKHSVERQTAHFADCFTTVSHITARECAQLLERQADVVLPNGFNGDFVSGREHLMRLRTAARERLMKVANALTGRVFPEDTFIVSTSGRYEFRNKGYDVFLDVVGKLANSDNLSRQVLAFIQVPAWSTGARADLKGRLHQDTGYNVPLEAPFITHWLHQPLNDSILHYMRGLELDKNSHSRLSLVFIPSYLDGRDGIFDREYYELLAGNDLCVYPSYYEPWGYTPLEAIAFGVPCITTDLAGFGQWVCQETGSTALMETGVEVVHRTDGNYEDVVEKITASVLALMKCGDEAADIGRKALQLSEKALWRHFIKYYNQAYGLALERSRERINVTHNKRV